MASARSAVATPAPSPTRRRAPQHAPQRAPRPEPRRAPAARPRARPSARRGPRQRLRHRGAISWIAAVALLLAGVVFINLAELRLNLRVEQATQARARLRVEDAALQSQLSSALASGRIQQLASTRDGLVQADPSTIGYINLGR